MFRDTIEIPVHGIVRNQVDFVPPACKIFSPALGMDAAAVGNKNDFHRGPPGYLCRPLRYVISSVVFPKKAWGFQHVRRIIEAGLITALCNRKMGEIPSPERNHTEPAHLQIIRIRRILLHLPVRDPR